VNIVVCVTGWKFDLGIVAEENNFFRKNPSSVKKSLFRQTMGTFGLVSTDTVNRINNTYHRGA